MASSVRGRTEITGQILEAVYDHGEDGNGVTQTRIGYTVHLNYGSLKEYLLSLTIHGLLSYDLAMRRYHITEKGMQFLDVWYNMSDMVNKLRQPRENKQERGRGTRIMIQNKKYRSRTEIIHNILQTARNNGNGLGKTKIMRNAFLSYHQVKEYVTILIENGLLQHDLGNQKFKTTEKGLILLQLCGQIDDLIGEEQRW